MSPPQDAVVRRLQSEVDAQAAELERLGAELEAERAKRAEAERSVAEWAARDRKREEAAAAAAASAAAAAAAETAASAAPVEEEEEEQSAASLAAASPSTPKDIAAPAAVAPSVASSASNSSAAAAAIEALRPFLFPSPASQNAARAVWMRGLLDWHDLVPDVYAVKDAEGAVKALQRMRREEAKARLLSLLGDWDAPRALPRPGQEADACRDVQKDLVAALLAESPVPRGDARGLAALVSNGTRVEAAAGRLRVDPDDLFAHRAPEVDHGPLGKLSACGRVRDPCVLHATARACVEDEYCGWCASSGGVCVARSQGTWPEKRAGRKVPVCPGPLTVTADSVPAIYARKHSGWDEDADKVKAAREAAAQRPKTKLAGGAQPQKPVKAPPPPPPPPQVASAAAAAAAALRSPPLILVDKFEPHQSGRTVGTRPVDVRACSFVITRRKPVALAFNDGNSKMAFHFFTETAPGWVRAVTEGGSRAGADYLALHTYVPQATWQEFPQMVSPFSDSCPRVLETEARDLAAGNVTVCFAAKAGPRFFSPEEAAAFSASAAAAATGAEASALPLTPEAAFGLSDPDLALVDPVTGAVVLEGGRGAPGGDVDASVAALLRAQLPLLERPEVAVAKGKRLGLAGLAAAARHAARLPYWATEAGLAALQSAGLLAGPSGLVAEADALAARLVKESSGGGGGVGLSFTSLLLSSLLLHEEGPSAEAPLVTFISRRNKRFIFNEAELVRVALALGARARVVALESTPLYEQLALLRQTSVLVGVHGSGLINSQVLRPGGAIIQLVPLGVRAASPFFQPTAEGNGVAYFEVRQQRRADTVPHLHFLDSSHADDHEEMFSSPRGSDCCGQAVFFSFWINQDGRYPTDDFAASLGKALDGVRKAAAAGRRRRTL